MIGVIADDVTGATDVASALSRAGLRTLLSLTADMGDPMAVAEAGAIVIGHKARSIAAPRAVARSLEALGALRQLGADSFYLKYCSTFDSSPEGNIGPVAEALASQLSASTVVTEPAAPLHGRPVYRGHLLVGDALLHETHLREHPVTPMRDSSVKRLLAAQVNGPVAVLSLEAVREGATAIRVEITAAKETGAAHLLTDSVCESDLASFENAINHDQANTMTEEHADQTQAA